MVGRDGVLIHPGVEPVLVVRHGQSHYIQAAVPLGHRPRCTGSPDILADHALFLREHLWVCVALEQVPLHLQPRRLDGAVGEGAGNHCAGARQAGDATRGLVGPATREYGPFREGETAS